MSTDIEKANKLLKDHQRIMEAVIKSTEEMMNAYIPNLKAYVSAVVEIQMDFSRAVTEVVRSAREMRVMTSGHQELKDYIDAAAKLEEVLSNPIFERLIQLIKEKDKCPSSTSKETEN